MRTTLHIIGAFSLLAAMVWTVDALAGPPIRFIWSIGYAGGAFSLMLVCAIASEVLRILDESNTRLEQILQAINPPSLQPNAPVAPVPGPSPSPGPSSAVPAEREISPWQAARQEFIKNNR